MLKSQRRDRRIRMTVVRGGVAICASLVIVASHSPLGSSSAIQAGSAQTPLTVVLLLAVGCGALALAALIVVVWPGPRPEEDEAPEFVIEPLRTHWVSKLAAVALPFVLGAGLIAAVALGSSGTRSTPAHIQPGRSGPPAPPTARSGHSGPTFAVPAWLPWLLVAVLVAALALLGDWLLRRWFTSGDGERPLVSPTEAAMSAASAALSACDEPRAAVIAAYVAMEQTLQGRGVPRSAAEAPREYLRRVLLASHADQREAETLTGLFEEARFSEHPIPERIRELALATLASLRSRMAGRSQ